MSPATSCPLLTQSGQLGAQTPTIQLCIIKAIEPGNPIRKENGSAFEKIQAYVLRGDLHICRQWARSPNF